VTRVAAVDLGTNTTRLLVADVDGDDVRELTRRSEITALGEGVDASRTLLPAAIERVRRLLDEYREEATRLGAERVLAVATSAVRDAANGREFLRGLEERYGFETRLLSGDEEAELTRRGAGIGDEETLLLDIGGGSTELSLGAFRTSLDVGSVRLTERHLRSDPPRADELAAAAAAVRAELPDLRPTRAVGVAGTVWQLEELAGRLTLPAVEAELRRLAALPLAKRRRIPKLHPERARVIVAGAVILAEVLRRYALAEIAFSVRDLLDGIALEAAAAE
jgi:exopolyphosphatase/guanosine-5'-triphosphate,3'-diphosphate pyrophosphatase